MIIIQYIGCNKMSLGIKEIVSKNKLRYKEDGFDLDLSYIARNIIAMGFPAETLERFFRNSINDVAKFFEIKHKNRYKIYNLCSESKRRYDTSKFNGMVEEEYSFQDHNPPPFNKLKPFCESVHRWLSADKNNVAAIHCKAGKGRTGVMICAYLIYAGKCEDINGKCVQIDGAESALEYYGRQRTRDLKGVTIPSQQRFVYYFEYLVKQNLDYRPVRLRLISLILTSLPHYITGGTYTIIVEIFTIPKQKIKSFDIEVKKGSKYLVFNIPEQLIIHGDIKFEFYIKKIKKEKIFQFCFNTFFVSHGIDTCTIMTENCRDCQNGGEKINILYKQSTNLNQNHHQNDDNSSMNNNCNNNKTFSNYMNNDLQSAVLDDLSFLEMAKHENMFFPCDCNSSLLTSSSSSSQQPQPTPPSSEMFESATTIMVKGNQDQIHREVVAGKNNNQNPILVSPSCKQDQLLTNPMICEIKMSESTSSTSSSNSSSTQSLCINNNNSAKKTSFTDLKRLNSDRNYYLIFPKEKLDKANKDKANKVFSSDFKVVLRFNQVEEQSTCSSSANNNNNNNTYVCDKNIECFQLDNFNSESENITSEDDDEPSDQEYHTIGNNNEKINDLKFDEQTTSTAMDKDGVDDDSDPNSKKGEITYL